MNIKKVDDRPTIIHTKEKTKLHIKAEPETRSKHRKKTVKNSAMKTAKEKYQKSTKDTAKKLAQKTIKATVKAAATTTATAVGTVIAPGVGTATGAASGYAARVAADHKDMQVINRNRKIKFFLDKLNEEEQQKDSFAKLAKDLVLNRASVLVKAVAPITGLVLTFMALLVAIVALPVIIMLAVIYNSPFAMFFPSISSGDTMQNVLSAYVTEFDEKVETELTNYSGYDKSKKIYADYEGEGEPDNYYDILAVYMVRYGKGDTATDMTDKAKQNLKKVYDDMCSYSISSGTDTDTDEEGNTITLTVKEVNVKLKNYQEMISEYRFDAEDQNVLAELMNPEYLSMIGYAGS